MNIDILKSNKLTKSYLCTLAGNSFHLTNNAPTRVSADTSSCIDHFIGKNIDEVDVKRLDDCFTDQFLLLLNFYILRNVERTEREKRDRSFLKCPQNSTEFENKLIAELNKCYQCVESSGDQIWLTIGFITRSLRFSINSHRLKKDLDRKLMPAELLKSGRLR